MKKFLFTLLTLLLVGVQWSTLNAQSFVIVDKNGNKITYDVSKLEQITFQQDPPGFTVYEAVEPSADESGEPEQPGEDPQPQEPVIVQTTFTFDEVKSIVGDPDFLFTHPDTVYVDGEGQNFNFQLRTNVDYDYKVSDSWLAFVKGYSDCDSLCFSAGLNPNTVERIGYIAFASKDEQMLDTVYVVQRAKYDSRYIAIDWTTTTLDSFDETSGKAQLTFRGDVPVMGDHDVVLLPSDNSYVIRVIDEVRQQEGTSTINLATRQGLMGNLFKDQKFSLVTESSGSQLSKRAAAYDGHAVYTPTKVEIFTGNEYVEVFNADKPRSRKAPKEFENEFVSWEYNNDGQVLWESGTQSLSWDKMNFSLGLKGLFSFDFGDIPWEKVRMGDLQHLKIAIEGGFNMELVMKYLVSSSVEWKKEWTLKEDVFNAKYTFMVGTVPVIITVGADLLAEVSLGASGEASITSGITASNTITCGVEWDAEESGTIKPVYECEKKMELVGPDLDINAHAEARATAYPEIKIGIYKVLCPTISPQPYLKAEADGCLVDNSKVAWSAGVSTGLDLGLGLSLDLFFWEWQLADMDPINVFDIPLVKLPDAIELTSESPKQMLKNNLAEVKYHVTNKNYITGTEYNAPGVLVKFEAEGGELQDEYGYTDMEGNVSAFFTLTDDVNGGKVKAEVIVPTDGDDEEGGETGGEGEGDEEEGIKADDWEAEGIQYRLTPEPAKQTLAEEAESATITFKLEQYSSKTATWTGVGGQTIYFEASGGSCNASGVTTNEGIATATFTPEEDFKEGSVTGTITLSEPGAWSGIATGKIYAEGYEPEEGVITDEGLKKADELDDNTYQVGEKVYDLAGEEDYAYFGKGSTGSGYNIDFCKEHPEYATVGWGGIFNVTPEMVGKEIDYLAEKAAGNETLYISLGTFIDPSLGWEAQNNMIEFSDGNLVEAKFLVRENEDGTLSALAHLKQTDGTEGWFKLRATPSP